MKWFIGICCHWFPYIHDKRVTVPSTPSSVSSGASNEFAHHHLSSNTIRAAKLHQQHVTYRPTATDVSLLAYKQSESLERLPSNSETRRPPVFDYPQHVGKQWERVSNVSVSTLNASSRTSWWNALYSGDIQFESWPWNRIHFFTWLYPGSGEYWDGTSNGVRTLPSISS